MANRPRTFSGALKAWPDRMAAVCERPCDETLQELCTLLDVMDGEIVRTWGADGHQERRGLLRECRAAATQANALVASTAVAARKAKGAAGAAARKAAV